MAAFQVLAIIEGAGSPLTPSVIAERMLTTTGSMTSLLDTLTRRGLVRRSAHPDDRRMLLVDITEGGRSLVDSVLPVTHRITKEVFAGFSERDRATFLRLLGRVEERLEAMRAEEAPAGPPPARRKPAA